MSRRCALLLALCLHPLSARAELEPRLVRLAPTASELREQRERALAQRIEPLLRALPEVAAAAVDVKLPEASETALNRPLPPPAVVLVLRLRAPGPSDASLRNIAAAVVPGATLSIVRRVDAPVPKLVTLGPFQVAASSFTTLRATLVALLTSNALLALLVLGRARRDRLLGPKVDRDDRSRDWP